jgi:hypothetical protein
MGGSATRKTGDVQGIFCNMREDKERREEGGHAMRKMERIMAGGWAVGFVRDKVGKPIFSSVNFEMT